ncbi:MAG: phosphatase PAP2 family protein [Bacteroidales bacterium]|nr:phosphatase PAP2 family protein [Bacteroidales bacterium]
MDRLKAALLLIALCLASPRAGAQRIEASDSLQAFDPAQLIAPCLLIGTGTAIHYMAHNTLDVAVQRQMQEWHAGKPDVPFDDYIQYAPLIMDLGLGFTGVKARNCFIDRTIEAAIAYASAGILGASTKQIFHTLRPNETNYLSFPSGHTIFAFTGAELVRREFGWGWGAGAYGIATTVAVMRVYRNWHWVSDVLAGAGIGILCANIGCWLLEPTKSLFGIELPDSMTFAVVPGVDPVSGTVCASLAMRF